MARRGCDSEVGLSSPLESQTRRTSQPSTSADGETAVRSKTHRVAVLGRSLWQQLEVHDRATVGKPFQSGIAVAKDWQAWDYAVADGLYRRLKPHMPRPVDVDADKVEVHFIDAQEEDDPEAAAEERDERELHFARHSGSAVFTPRPALALRSVCLYLQGGRCAFEVPYKAASSKPAERAGDEVLPLYDLVLNDWSTLRLFFGPSPGGSAMGEDFQDTMADVYGANAQTRRAAVHNGAVRFIRHHLAPGGLALLRDCCFESHEDDTADRIAIAQLVDTWDSLVHFWGGELQTLHIPVEGTQVAMLTGAFQGTDDSADQTISVQVPFGMRPTVNVVKAALVKSDLMDINDHGLLIFYRTRDATTRVRARLVGNDRVAQTATRWDLEAAVHGKRIRTGHTMHLYETLNALTWSRMLYELRQVTGVESTPVSLPHGQWPLPRAPETEWDLDDCLAIMRIERQAAAGTQQPRTSGRRLTVRFAEQLEESIFVETEYGLPLDATDRQMRAFYASRKRSELRTECDGASGKKRKQPASHGLLQSHSMEQAAESAALLFLEVRSWRVS